MATSAVDRGDYLLTTYIQAWGTHSLLSHPRNIFNMNMLYPAKHVMAASENLLGNQLIFAPFYLVTRNPLFAANVVLFSSFLFCGLLMYLLVHDLTRDPRAAAIAGFVYAFSPARIAQRGHSQLLSMQWIPLAILFLVLYFFKKRDRYLICFCGAVFVQILSSLYLGYIALLICSAFLGAILLLHPDTITRRAVLSISIGAIAIGIILLPILLPYLNFQKQGLMSPDAALATSASASAAPINSYLNIGGGSSSHVYSGLLGSVRSPQFNWEKILFPGLIAVALTIVTLVSCFYTTIRYSRAVLEDRLNRVAGPVAGCLILGSVFALVASYILSLGPYLWVGDHVTRFRLPFFWLRRWVPGLAMFRVPARFGLGTTFPLAILAGLGWSWVLFQLRRFRHLQSSIAAAALTAIVLLGLTLEFTPAPFPLYSVMTQDNVAPEYRWLAKQAPNQPSIELPINFQGPSPDPVEEVRYAYNSTFHWQPLVNGYTGYEPLIAVSLLRIGSRLPHPQSVITLANSGVRFAVVHFDAMSEYIRQRWRSYPSGLGVTLVADFGNAAVYELNSAQATASLNNRTTPSFCSSDTAPMQSVHEGSNGVLAPQATNSGFEDGQVSPWLRFGNVIAAATTDVAHSGTHSLAETEGAGSVYQDVAGLVPSGKYTVTAWTLVPMGATASTQIAVYSPALDSANFSSSSSCTAGWQQLSQSATAGEDGTLRVHLFRNAGSGTVYWDDIRIFAAK